MSASTFGLIVELLLFALGLYLYLFARGVIAFGSADARARAEAFRKDNATWMRLLGLALAAIMGLNVFLHLRELFG
ncbi:hypothetical protein QWY85_10760 [Neolewinella lacunae]|uniref:Uncharacterized protein n=1 Tax=Neolewinella lacunae TaxID=1517758 RepID=A0A923T8W7_9BACT|nr:hypothetical protein [Neolewinella lacunae]MBC6996070.1 hypothetical protein [Neolewinella lacunae]MDN3635139.1 hypothetical protein [Neolewinella lacunae]